MLAVVGGKGGVGKTTTARGVATALAGQRRRPLLVDVDTDMPDLATLTGVASEPGLAAVRRGADPERVARPDSDFEGVAVLPAAPGTSLGDALTCMPRHRPVILDCPPGASDAVVTPLSAADQALLVTTPDRPAIRDAIKTAALARSVDTPLTGVVLTQTDTPPTGLGQVLETEVLGCVPPVADPPLSVSAVRATYDRLTASIWGKG